MFKLVIQDDEGKTTVVPLARDEITIGRKEGNTIRLTERNVSRRHARIVRNNGEVTIEDLGSYNGIRVNNSRIAERVQLRVSDQVQIGDYKLFLKAEGIEHVDDAKTVPIERVETATSIDAVPAIEPVAAMATPVPGSLPPNGQLIGNPNRTLVAIADTDPTGRPIASPAVHGSLNPPVGYARLVVLSSNFAGSEFELSRPQMIVGRTEENDIVINHRSISRNHAKVVREPDTGRYTISDLQSSNGVRVNGQDYGKVELRRGDVIDLGHVRMRFVDAGEEYVFTRDAIEDVPEEGRGRGLWILVALAALVLAVGSYFAFVRGAGGGAGGGSGGSAGGSNVIVATTPDAAPAIPVPDAAPQVAPPDAAPQVAPPDAAPAATPDAAPQVTDDPLPRKSAECQNLLASERWAELKACANELRGLGDVAQATKLATQAENERKAKLQVDQFNAAERRKDYATMQRLARGIPDESQYAAGIRGRWSDNKEKLVRDADKAAKAGRCADVKRIASVVRSFDKGAADNIANLACDDPSKKPCSEADKVALDSRIDAAWGQYESSPTEAMPTLEKVTATYGQDPCVTREAFSKASYGALRIACMNQQKQKAETIFNKRKRFLGAAASVPEKCGSLFAEQ